MFKQNIIHRSISSRVDILYFFLMGLIISVLSILKYEALQTSYYDLGFYESLLTKYNLEKSWMYVFNTHINIFIVPYAFFYRLVSSPYTLLIIQSFSIAIAGYLVAIIFTKKTKCQKTIFFIIYYLYAPVWYGSLVDFHFEHLFVLLSSIFYFTIESEIKHKKEIIISICVSLCLIKEVYALFVVMLGIYIAFKYKSYLLGAIISTFALLYFVLSTQIIIPSFSNGQNTLSMWNNAFAYLGNNMWDMFIKLIKEPGIIFKELLTDNKKILYIIFLFGPFLFLSILSPLELIPIIPILFISILSHNQNHYSIVNQYSTGIIVPIFIAFIESIGKTNKIYNRISSFKNLRITNRNNNLKIIIFVILSSVIFNIFISPSPISRFFWIKKVSKFHFSSYIATSRERMIKDAINMYIPDDQNVVISSQNSLNYSQLANRKYYFCFPEGVLEPVKTYGNKKILADYVLLDQKRAIFLKDIGCEYIYYECKNKSIEQKYYKIIKLSKKYFDILFSNDGFLILKRNRSIKL